MSRIAIHFFTSTGNTARAVRLIADKLEKAGHEVATLQVTKGTRPPADRSDAHIFVFSVFAFSAPALMKRYMRALRSGDGGRTAVLAVNGALCKNGVIENGYAGQATEQAEHILRRRGYNVRLTGVAGFPDNFTQLAEPPDAAGVKAILERGDATVDEFTGKFLADKEELVRIGIFNRIWTRAANWLFGVLGRRMLGKFYIADRRCNACGICAQACPARTIRLRRGFPTWRANCEACNRCINLCPQSAIQTSAPLAILHLALQAVLLVSGIAAILDWAPRLMALPPSLLAAVEIAAIVTFVLLVIWFQLVPLDFILGLLARVKPIRRFFSLSWTKRYRRYLAPGFKPLRPV